MNTLAKILVLLAAPLVAWSQSFDRVPIVAGGTNNVAASTTITSGTAGGGVSVARIDTVGLLITQRPAATNLQANVVYSFARGISATEVESTPSVVVTIPTSTNAMAQSVWTSVTVPGASYLKLVSIANAADVPITNITVTAVRKSPSVVSLPR